MTFSEEVQVTARCSRCGALAAADGRMTPAGDMKDVRGVLGLHRVTLLMIKSGKTTDDEIKRDNTFTKRATGTLCGECHQAVLEGCHVLAECARQMIEGAVIQLTTPLDEFLAVTPRPSIEVLEISTKRIKRRK